MNFEYKEIVKKNGKHLIFCNFEDLLKDAYGVSTMDQVEAVMEKKGSEIICHCPWCRSEGHTKHKLYMKDDFTVAQCFVCGRIFCNVTDTLKTDVIVPSAFSNFGAGPLKFELPVMKNEEWNLDKYKYEFDDYDEAGMKYLLGRHGFFKDLAKALGFKFWNGNVVLPFKHNGEVYYYQIRFTGKNNKIRYFLPPVSQKSCYIIERSEEDVRHRILIVEGVFDAVSILPQCPDFTPVAVLGSSISDYQIAQIREYAGYVSELAIWMDEFDISLRIKKKVRSIIDYCPIHIIYSNGPDPEERLQKKLKYGLPLIEYRSEDAIRKEQERDAELKEQQESWNVGTSDGRGSSEVPSGES